MDLAPGQLVAGRYRLEQRLGKGGMGEVWVATHMLTGKRLALKFLVVKDGTLSDLRHRFVREARAATAVDHPNVVAIHDVLELPDQTLMVMELLQGETLGRLLERRGALDLREVSELLLPVVSAVGTAHSRGIVHRDLKPENIFLARDDEDAVKVKVLDFGIAKLTVTEAGDVQGITDTGTMLGTPYYMAPEQVFGERDVDYRVDIWALGVILYECLTGGRPFEGDNLGQVIKAITARHIPPISLAAPELPEDIANLIGKMLDRNRSKRPKDLREVFECLRRYTSVSAKTFGPPLSGAHGAGPSTPPGSGQVVIGSVTTDADAATRPIGMGEITGAPHSITQPISMAKKRWPLVAAGVALLAVVSWRMVTPKNTVSQVASAADVLPVPASAAASALSSPLALTPSASAHVPSPDPAVSASPQPLTEADIRINGSSAARTEKGATVPPPPRVSSSRVKRQPGGSPAPKQSSTGLLEKPLF